MNGLTWPKQQLIASVSLTPMVAAMTKTGLTLLAEQQGDVAAAKQLYEGLGRQEIVGALETQPYRLLGLLAQIMGTPDKAAGHFKDAPMFCRRGYRPELGMRPLMERVPSRRDTLVGWGVYVPNGCGQNIRPDATISSSWPANVFSGESRAF